MSAVSRILQHAADLIRSDRIVEAERLCLQVLRCQQGQYRFSAADLTLHMRERLWQLPRLESLAADNDMQHLRVNDVEFYWPAGSATQDLTWLYAEVFFPREGNPSSYDHPQIPYDELAWAVDAGACEGFFTRFAFQRGVNRVVAIEPVPFLAQCLERTFSGELGDGRFSVLPVALGRADGGHAAFVADHGNLCEAHLAESGSEAKTALTCPIASLDVLAEREGLHGRGLVKMDVEGAEMDALAGASQLLAHHKPYLTVAVYHSEGNALACRDVVLAANPTYTCEFRGMYGWFDPPRPYMLIAW